MEQPNILNKSKSYVLAYFNEYIKVKFLNKLTNTYIFYENEYAFCLRYDYSGKKEFTEYERELEKNKYYKFTIDINKKEVLYVFDIPEELFNIVDLYTQGKYSYLPNRELLINFLVKNFGVNIDSKIIKIINRDTRLKYAIEEDLDIRIPEGMDLSSPPDLERENYLNQINDKKEYIDKD